MLVKRVLIFKGNYMKNGKYRISFEVDLNDCATQEEAEQTVASLVSETLDEDSFPEIEFELLEALDMEYNTDDEVEELNF